MKKNEIENALSHMIGKPFTYNKEQHLILRYDLNDTRLKITTDVKDIVILTADISDMLNKFEKVEEVEAFVPEVTKKSEVALPSNALTLQRLIKQTTIGSMAQELKSEVMDAIKKVKEDPSYIPQATAINDGVKQILDIAKSEIDMFRVMDSINRS